MRRASARDLYRFRAWLRLWLARVGPRLTMLAAERYAEVPTLLNWLRPRPSERLLDCGSARSTVPAYVAVRYGSAVHALDRWDEIAGQRQIAAALRAAGAKAGQIHALRADLTALPYAGERFDAALAVSTVEHVADDGAAMGELARILRPGGALALSVPFAAAARERWRDEAVYDRTPDGGAVFFERVYDWAAVEERLVRPSGLRLEGRAIYAWDERDRARAARLRVFPLRGLAELWLSSRATIVPPDGVRDDQHAVCCLLLRRGAS